jgi:hypothetical protein
MIFPLMNKSGDNFTKILFFEHPENHSSLVGHYPFLRWLLTQISQGNYLELGLHWGETLKNLFNFAEASNLDFNFTGVDNFIGDDHAGKLSFEVYEYCKQIEDINSKRIEILKGDFSQVIPTFSNNKFNLVIIDGYHDYHSVKNEFQSIISKVREDGIVIFHDINEKSNGFTTYKFWEEIKENYKTFEFPHAHGLGILFLNSQNKIVRLMDKLQENNQVLIFELVGNLYHEINILRQYKIGFEDVSSRLHNTELSLIQLSQENSVNIEIISNITTSNSWRKTKVFREIRNKIRHNVKK